jgi:hypothetical protein
MDVLEHVLLDVPVNAEVAVVVPVAAVHMVAQEVVQAVQDALDVLDVQAVQDALILVLLLAQIAVIIIVEILALALVQILVKIIVIKVVLVQL